MGRVSIVSTTESYPEALDPTSPQLLCLTAQTPIQLISHNGDTAGLARLSGGLENGKPTISLTTFTMILAWFSVPFTDVVSVQPFSVRSHIVHDLSLRLTPSLNEVS